MHFTLTYEYANDYLAKREEFRAEHLRYAWASVERDELLLGGAVGEPASEGLLIFDVPDTSSVEDFAKADPYVTGGVVRSWRVAPWATVVGATATSPVHPD
ncbi:YciI-like protein [Saxibacter everestensis]|uniref:YciI-like protein n=1 Tax=Saxibacter everestensis TaxID=2909229 RepID=A0ABY8QY49_9MICO|nr:YciI-like protein [Brevibacteriaceae bacterium ZFBP1038]